MNWSYTLPLIAFLFIIFAIALYSRRFLQTEKSFVNEFFIGNRAMGGFVLAMTMIATYGSAGSFIGGPGAAYYHGLGWVFLAMSQVVTGYFVLMILGKKFAIVARQIGAVTLIDYLKYRYQSKIVVILSALSIIIFLFAAMAAQWIGGAHLIATVTGIGYQSALAIFAITVIFYVVLGGFRAVVLTDVVQGSVMLLGTIIILCGTIYAGGGITNIMQELQTINPNLLTPFGATGELTLTYLSSFWILVGVAVIGLPQITVRAMAYKNSLAMHKAIIIGTFVIGFIMLGIHLAGTFARVILPDITNYDSVMPLLAMEVLPPWLAGIVLAAPMAAIMSTVDSLLLVVSATIIKDVTLNYINPNLKEKTIKYLSLLITAVVGISVFILAIDPPELLIWINLFAFGGLEAVFVFPIIFGLYWKTGNAYGALSAMLVGLVSYIYFHAAKQNPLGMHPVVLSLILSAVSYCLVSWLSRIFFSTQTLLNGSA